MSAVVLLVIAALWVFLFVLSQACNRTYTNEEWQAELDRDWEVLQKREKDAAIESHDRNAAKEKDRGEESA